jgi:hypothetical protein
LKIKKGFFIKLEKCRWDNSESVIPYILERNAVYPIFADTYYLELGIIASVGGFCKPNLPKVAGICVKSKGTMKSIRSNCIHTYSLAKGD